MPPDNTNPAISDDDRSCFGLGWEYCRRGWDIEFNPFAEGSPQWAWFNQGWLAKEKLDLDKAFQEEGCCGR